MRLAAALATALALTPVFLPAANLTDSVWHVRLESDAFGPVEFHLTFVEQGGDVVGRSLSGAVAPIRALPGEGCNGCRSADALLAFRLSPSGDSGELTAPSNRGSIALSVVKGRLEGTIADSLLAGSFTAEPVESAAAIRDYQAVWRAVEATAAAKVYSPAALDDAAYLRFLERMRAVAAAARDDLDLLLGFRFAWTGRPFSHFELRRADDPAADMMAYMDGFRTGTDAARLNLDGPIATLTVDTMMGVDTIEQIEAAYRRLATSQAEALVIDLRANGGGAFAVKPLVEHILDEPVDAGYFVSQPWNRRHDRLPTATELADREPWRGWSIRAFWQSVQDQGVLTLRFEPSEPRFAGPVFVLTSGRTASAAELAVDALRASGRATVIGEKTAGEMLSQSPFDAAEGFLLSVPVADYYSVAHGRIEGAGVTPDIAVPAESAAAKAVELARERLAR